MMRITVDIVPFGIEDGKRTIHTIEIANVGKVRDPDVYQYRVRLDGTDHGHVEHRRSHGALTLSAIVLDRIDVAKFTRGADE